MAAKKHISEVSKDAALANIKRKHALVLEWIENGQIPWQIGNHGEFIRNTDGELVLDWYPSSIPSFAKWTGKENCPCVGAEIKKRGGFKGFGRSTLDKYERLKNEINRSLTALKKIADAQARSHDKTTQIGQLQSKLRIEKIKREEAQTRYLNILRAHSEIDEKLRWEQRAHTNNVQLLQRQLEVLKADNARLTATLAKISPMKSVRSGRSR